LDFLFLWFLNFLKLGTQVAIGPELFFLANIRREITHHTKFASWFSLQV
jgi:hypothetical protein